MEVTANIVMGDLIWLMPQGLKTWIIILSYLYVNVLSYHATSGETTVT